MALGENFDAALAAARSGADRGWEVLYRDLSPVVLGYLRTSACPDPEDVLGEVFLQAVRDLPGFTGGEREFRAWLFTIAHHRLLDARRGAARRPTSPASSDDLERQGPVGDAEDDALREIALERAVSLLARLSPDQRAVLLLRVVGDLTVEEVARVTGRRPGAVKALQRRGLAALRRELAKEGVTL